MSVTRGHFDALYTRDPDPWQVTTSWYEQRKQRLLLAALPSPRFGRAFEPACGTGELTRALAARCDTVLASDGSTVAVRVARARLEAAPHVSVLQQALPAAWPTGRFDLVVLSEWLYYLDRAAMQQVAALSRRSLGGGGTLVACHWRPDFDDRQLDTAQVHATLGRLPGLRRLVRHEEAEFLLEVWSCSGQADEDDDDEAGNEDPPA